MSAFAAVLVFATLVEAIVEYATKPLDGTAWQLPAFVKQYVAMAAGIGVCLWYSINLVSILSELLARQGVVVPVPPYDLVGMILTGLAVGRGSNVFNDFTDLLRGKINATWNTAKAEDKRADEAEVRMRAVVAGRENV